MSSPVSGINSVNRTPAGRNRTSAKPSFQSTPVFEGVYNNARMLHFLTAVVGSTCDIRVKNGSVFEGIFKTLSSRCELAVDAVHKRTEEGSTSAPPRREDITDTMIFSPSDLVTMTCRDVDLNYATRDTFTDTAISSTRINGEHKEKVLQRWEGGDSNGESYDLENDASNGWDANEMFRYNEVKYGITSTYDSSLSMYTVPLERGNSEVFRQREARAARLASEIESSPQYRHRVNLENDEGKTEEDKYSAVLRDGNDRERGRESPRDRERERGRDSPGASNREGKYIPLPQRQREMNRERAERGSGGPPPHNRYRSTPPSSSSSSPRPPLPSAAGPQPGVSPSERSSPLSGRGGAYAPHHPQGSPSPGPGSGPASPYTPTSSAGPVPTPTPAAAAPSSASPPAPHGHTVPHSHSLPHSLSDAGRPVNGVAARTSPKAQRPPQSSRTGRTSNSHSQSTATRSPKSGSSQDTPYLDTSSVSLPAQKTSGPAPLFPVDVNEILGAAAKERSAESPGGTEESKNSKAPSVQQRSQIEELRKFGKEFRLQPSGGNSSSPSSPAAATPPAVGEITQASAAKPLPSEAHSASESKPQPSAPSPSQSQPQPQPSPALTEDLKDTTSTPATTTQAATAPHSERQSPAAPQPSRTPGSEESRSETTERAEGVTDQVKKSTLNPNAKEFNPIKPQMPMTKPNTAPTPPRPTPPSPVVLQHPGGQGPLYNAPYLSYVSQIHSVQPPPMYQYTMSTVNQGKYPRTKGSVVAPRSDHGASGPPMLQAAASAAGAPLVASPYPQSYLQYNPQQYSQQQVIQAMTPYPGQPMYSMLQGGARMIGQGGGPHPQALGPPGGPQFPTQGEGPQGPQQGIYAPQSFSHHSGAVHQPQPSSTPTGNQPPPQHAAPSPGQNAQSGPQPQSLYHSGPLSAPTPPNMPPGHTSPQGSYPLQGYSIHSHQGIPPTYPLGQIAQAHVQGPMSGPHHSGSHGQPQLVMLQPPQQGPGAVPQHPQHGPQQGTHQHFYIGHPQPMQVQTHPASFHPPGN
ncbi:ataxin-2-like protein isoform X2 [Parambassis ranga]|nr:ataxin-2-like protein isoform X2 [Parambassis ranga]XP_028286716.1 ataxin-2-like protein isoform X2 [Parambassis ranga]